MSNILWAIDAATRSAMESPCEKSKRGVAIFDEGDGSIVTTGFNGPPGDIACSGTKGCRRDCGLICVHAEQRAILSALAGASSWKKPDLSGFGLLHIKVVDGVGVPGGPPSCWQCSKLILEVNIDSVWLYEDIGAPLIVPANVGRWQRYTAKDFHLATLHNYKDGPLHGARP